MPISRCLRIHSFLHPLHAWARGAFLALAASARSCATPAECSRRARRRGRAEPATIASDASSAALPSDGGAHAATTAAAAPPPPRALRCGVLAQMLARAARPLAPPSLRAAGDAFGRWLLAEAEVEATSAWRNGDTTTEELPMMTGESGSRTGDHDHNHDHAHRGAAGLAGRLQGGQLPPGFC